MKKVISFFSIILIIFSLIVCSQIGKTNNVTITIGKSVKFSDKEISDAVESVKKKFKDFKGCNLTDLWYDEDKSNALVEDYLKYGGGSKNGSTSENVIILMSNFDVGPSGADGSFSPNSTSSNWQWILVRDSKTSKWNVVDWGY